MTMIAFATYGRRAELITDSVCYTAKLEKLGRTTKHLTLNHLDAAVMTQGSSLFGEYAMSACRQLGAAAATFDELVETVVPHFADLLSQVLTEDPEESPEATVALIGWSSEQERFAGFVCASEDGFEPVEVRGLWVFPSPWTNRPSELELERVTRWMKTNPATPKTMTAWAAKPRRDKPASIQNWYDLAGDCRIQRALAGDYAHVLVGGDVTHTRLERGSVVSQRILTFHDEGDELLEAVRGSQHPIALAAECHCCDSGKAYGDCHGARCSCGSEKLAWDCCTPVQRGAV